MPAKFAFHAYLYRGQGNALGLSLETISERFASISGLFFEWDGSFTWANQKQGWEISGTVYDDGQEVQYVDFRGRIVESESCQPFQERIGEFFAVWETEPPNDRLTLMRLPERRWQDLQSFENEVSNSVNPQSDPNATDSD